MPVRLVRRLVAVVVVVGLVLVGLDVGTRVLAQDELAGRARDATGAGSASASIGGFPFLGHLVVQGKVPELEVRLRDVPVGVLRLQAVDVQLRGTVVDRAALVDHRSVRVESIAAGTATITVTAAELSAAAGVPVALPGGGRAVVTVAGRPVPASVRIVGGHLLELVAGGIVLLHSDLAASPMVPSCSLQVSIGTGAASISCHVAPVPARLVHALAGA